MSAPEPHVRYDDPPPRFRWVPPLMIGLTFGGIAGVLVTFVLMSATGRPGSAALAAEQFDPQRVLNQVPFGSGVSVSASGTPVPLGRDPRGIAVRRRITYRGTLPPGADFGALLAQIEAELIRAGGLPNSRGRGTTSREGFSHLALDYTYTTRDGRHGTMDVELTVENGNLYGLVVLAEGR